MNFIRFLFSFPKAFLHADKNQIVWCQDKNSFLQPEYAFLPCGGQALIAERFPFETMDSDEENGMFAIIQSWDEDTVHADMQKFIGKKVRVTIEII